MDTNCSILVTSCDKYEDAWKPFFELFRIMWQDCPYPIYLNTETKSYKSDSFDITSLHPSSLTDKKGKEISWSRRLKEALEHIETEYVLFFLEDFFLMSPVRSSVVSECIDWMVQDKDIAVIDFYPEYHKGELFHEEFSEINPKYDFCINTMSALWRKDFLINILRDESPWDFEFYATGRWRRTNYKIYTHRKEYSPIFDYKIIPDYGYGIYQGKWLKKNVELFERYEIKVDFTRRGFIEAPKQIQQENHLKKNFLINLFSFKKYAHYAECIFKITAYQFKKFRSKWFNF